MPHPHRLELTVSDAPGVLERIVSCCRSRQCTISSLRFIAADRHRVGSVEITFDGPQRSTRMAAERLGRLVDVLEVRDPVASRPVADGRAPRDVAAPALRG